MSERAERRRHRLATGIFHQPKDMRPPLKPGTRIDYSGEKATVVHDDGGDTLDVQVDGMSKPMRWYWKFDGVECTVIK